MLGAIIVFQILLGGTTGDINALSLSNITVPNLHPGGIFQRRSMVRPKPLVVNDYFETLEDIDKTFERPALEKILRALKEYDIKVSVAGVAMTDALLTQMITAPRDEPITRLIRETTMRPVDVRDWFLFWDDVLSQAEKYRGLEIYISSGRARAIGMHLHPKDVFYNTPRTYPYKSEELAVDRPSYDARRSAAKDGDVLGPNWIVRFPNPSGARGRWAALQRKNPSFAQRMRSLLDQLAAQGANVQINSTLRRRERGYLMWGAFILQKATTEAEVEGILAKLWDRKKRWGLVVPIRWRHPAGYRATIEAARRMADAYDVVYATERGAKSSHHYTGAAADCVALNLPRRVKLRAPDGARRSFDLSDEKQSRDLNLSPDLVTWIERHFDFKKLKSDYPHWTDARLLAK